MRLVSGDGSAGPNVKAMFRTETGSSAPPAPAFTPADLSLSAWFRASYTSPPPWVGRASAGTSAAKNLTTAASSVTDPSAGTAVNGLTPAHFDGTDVLLLKTGATQNTLSDIIGTGSWSYG